MTALVLSFLKPYAALIMAGLGAALWAGLQYLKGRAAGAADERAKQAAIDNRLKEKLDEIDRDVPDFDAAAQRLRDRATPKR